VAPASPPEFCQKTMGRIHNLKQFFFVMLGIAALFGAFGAQAQTVNNVAAARWNVGTAEFAAQSNNVSINVISRPQTLATFVPATSSGQMLSFTPSSCGNVPLVIPGGLVSGTNVASTTQTTSLHIGEALFFRMVDATRNTDSSKIDSIIATIVTTSGDRETITVFETDVNSGVFVGAVPTTAIPPSPVQNDCRLSVAAGDVISIECRQSGNTAPIATGSVDVLADPFGLIFDSEDGTPINGVKVSIVDALTGAPARVFGDDGVTPYPSTMYSGQPVTDSAGHRYTMLPGEYRFPLAPFGQYRIVVEPSAPYSAPSTATAAQLAHLTRPDGHALLISNASFGGSFALVSLAAVRVDIPLDRPRVSVSLSKTVSRASAAAGDVVFYTVTASNPDTLRAKRNVTVVDSASPWLRLRADSVRLDGLAAASAVTPAADGHGLTAALGDIAPGQTRILTYAMTLRADAPAGQAINRAVATDARGNQTVASAVLRIEQDTIAGRMTLIGRITAGDCSVREPRQGIPGVRVMLEDGSFAITDADGRYHFEGLFPGTHVVQAQAVTLLEGGNFTDCARSTRTAGSANSRFITGQGGSLLQADFSAIVPHMATAPQQASTDAPGKSDTPAAGKSDAPVKAEAVAANDDGRIAAGAETNWLAMGDGPIDWLFPALDHNPRAPAIRVVIRHRVGQKVELSLDGKPVDKMSADGSQAAPNGAYAVSVWRGVPITGEVAHLTAVVRNADGSVAANLMRDVHFVAIPARAEIVAAASHLVADGAHRPVLAIRILDRRGLPVHAGLTGQFAVNAPYESAEAQDAMQSRALSGQNRAAPTWTVKGDDGIALVELAPTMVSGALHLDFTFSDREVHRQQTLEAWLVPGEQDWTLVGLAEGSVGAKSVADNMERSGTFDSDLGNHARIAFYAKGRVLGRYLLTMSYDSAKQSDEQRLLGAIDPNAYYTVFADGSDRRFDAASREKLYVRIETATFYAMFGDFNTGFDQTQLARYQRTTTGVKGEVRLGGLHAQAFGAKIASTHRHDEIQGGGITGPYRLTNRALIANSEIVTIEVRDRFRSELIVDRRALTRFIDYDIDLLSGTISFKQPILSRDSAQNPQFIVVDYEVDSLRGGELNAGVRADLTTSHGNLRIGATVVTDKGDDDRTNLAAVDAKAHIGESLELRAEAAASRAAGVTSTAWLAEAEFHNGNLDMLAYVRSADAEFGLGQQSAAERGRRKVGFDARYSINEQLSISGSAWHDDSLVDRSRRDAIQVRSDWRTSTTDARIALTSFNDHLDDGRKASSNVLEAGATKRLFDNKLELDAQTSIALGKSESIDLPARHRLSARYAITSGIKVIGSYEIADSATIKARTARGGFEVTPWGGARAIGTIGQQSISELGSRSFAAFGLAQSLDITKNLTIDASIDSNRTIGGVDFTRIVNPNQPVASGGNLGENGSIGEDFTAITLGAAYRSGRWSATMRGEIRNGQYADRKGFTFGAIRQLGEGSMVGSGFTWTRATANSGATTEVFDGAIAAAHRPAGSTLAFLTKLEFRSDKVTDAVAGEVGPAGRTALTVTGDAQSRRLIGSFSANWSPKGYDDQGEAYQRSEIGLFLAIRHNFDRFQGFDLTGTTVLAGLDARFGLGDKIEVGAVVTARSNFSDHTTSFAFGPQIGFTPVKDVLLTLGYNITGFRDRDFAAARNTDKGIFAALRMKFDADSFSFLGLSK